MTYFRNVTLDGGRQLDAFNRLRTSSPQNLFDCKLQYGLEPDLFETVVTGTGTVTHLPSDAAAQMSVAASGDKVVRQSYQYVPYRPGKSQLILVTGTLTPSANTRQRLGYFDASNGVFFQATGTDLAVVLRSSTYGTVDNVVPQASWNVDKLDGTGPSGITLDPSKALIYGFDLQWLGVGTVRCFVEVDGEAYVYHMFHWSNVGTDANGDSLTYMTTATLPVRYEIEALDTIAFTVSMFQICSTVVSEGAEPLTSGQIFSAANGTTTVAVSTRRAVLSIRPAATFNSLTNRISIIPESLDWYVSGNTDIYWELVRGRDITLGGTPSWAAVNAESSAERDVAATTVTGGDVVLAGYATGTKGGSSAISINFRDTGIVPRPLTLDAAGGTPELLSMVATGIGGTATVAASVTWSEVR